MKKLFKNGLMLLVSLASTSALAASFTVDGVSYNITTGSDSIPTVAVTTGSYSGDIVIPGTVTNDTTSYSVTSIEAKAFRSNSAITSISLPEGLKAIGNNAFQYCSKLKDVTFPSTLESIGTYAFNDCDSIKSIILPEKMSSMGTYAFYHCSNLKTLVISDSLSVIPDNAFYYCSNLKEIILPAKLQGIGVSAFQYCSNINKITAHATTPPTSVGSHAISSIPTNIYMYVPKGSGHLYSANSNWSSQVIIEGTTPTKVEVNVATAGDLGNQLLNKVEYLECINELTITGTLNSNDYYQIQSCTPNLIKIDMSGVKMTTLPESFFNNRKKLREIILPKTLTSISNYAMGYCTKLKSIEIPDGVTSLGNSVLSNCNALESILLPKTLKTIGNSAFSSCIKLKSIEIPDSVTSLGSSAFSYCTALKTATIGDGIKTIPSSAFYYCTNLINIKLPQYLTSIGSSAFYYCTKLASIELPYTLTSLGDYAFQNCTALTEVTLPAKLQKESRSFYNCTGIKKMTSLASVPPTCYVVNSNYYGIMYGVDKTNVELLVPTWALNEYKLAKGWNEFATIKGIDTDDNIVIYGGKHLTLEEGRCPNHEPDVTIYGNGVLEVYDGNTLTINNYQQVHGLTYNNTTQTRLNSRMISYSPSVTADTVKLSLNITYNYNRWAFISLPFDCYVKDITTNNDVRFAIRRYDGENRAAITGETSWKDMTSGMMLNAGEGYILQMESNSTIHFLAADNANKNKLFTNAEISRTLNEYDSEYAHNRSWNFIGNPYGCYYDIRFLNYDSPLTIYNGNGYTAYSPIDDAYILNPMEGFFVQKPSDVDAIVFNPDGRQFDATVRELTSTVSMSAYSSPRHLFDLTLTDAEGASDNTRVVLNQEMTMNYDMSRDASKFMSDNISASQLYTHHNSVRYAINERPLSDGTANVGFHAGNDGEYTITLSRNSSNKEVYLIDNYTNRKVRLDIVESYTFTADAGNDESRFVLSFNADPSGIETVENIDSKVVGNNSSIIVNSEVGSEIKVYNLSGQIVTTATATDTETAITVAPGFYVVTVGQNVYKTTVR